METISKWLASLGLSEYEGRFAENGIDISVVPDLTDQDLKDIGVLLGHRRKMLRAIGALAGAGTATQPPAVAPEPEHEHDAERRQVTVMFTDLVGSTALSAMACSSILAIPGPTRTTPSGPCGRDWS